MSKSYNIDYFQFIKTYLSLNTTTNNNSQQIINFDMYGGRINNMAKSRSNISNISNISKSLDNLSSADSMFNSSSLKNKPIWFDNFMGLYEKTKPNTVANIHNMNSNLNPNRIIPMIHPDFGNKTSRKTSSKRSRKMSREMAYDDKMKKKKKGIYRVKYEDQNDLDKKGVPKTKFKYYHIDNNKEVSPEELIRINKLGLAPAYVDVWVSSDPISKIQATGMDLSLIHISEPTRPY